MGSAIIFSGNDVKTLKSNIDLNGNSKILSGTTDPTSVATSAPVGSLYLNTSNGRLYRKLDSGSSTNWVQVGSGASGINYISNPDAEANVTGWSAYADAAGASPVDGTGGAPTVTITRTTSTPLRGTGSFLITKDAANRQGEGASVDFIIDEADKAGVLEVSFDYNPSAAFVAGDSSDIRIYLYDVTNAQVIQPAPYTIQGGNGANHEFKAAFQTNSNSSSYRLIFHVATTNAAAWTLKFDNVRVGPQSVLYGAIITDWASFTPTGSWSTNTTYTGRWRRVGDTMHAQVLVSLAGAPTAATLTVNLPSGYTADTSKLTSSTADQIILGNAFLTDSGTAVYEGVVNYNSTTSVKPRSGGTSNQANEITATAPYTFASGDLVSFEYFVPISGWGAVTQVSSDADTRVLAFKVGKVGNQNISDSTTTKVTWSATPVYDTHGGWDSTNNRYVIYIPGFFKITALMYVPANTTGSRDLYYRINGVATDHYFQRVRGTDQDSIFGGSNEHKLSAGDYIEVFYRQNSGGTLGIGDSALNSNFLVERLTGPSAIAASELVAARYFASSTSISGTLATIVWTTKDFDTHSALSSGVFTAPATGKYLVGAAILLSGTFVLNNTIIMEIQKNGTVVSRSTDYAGGAVTQLTGDLSDIISCVAGDTLRVQVSTTGTGPAIVASNFDNFISISRQGF